MATPDPENAILASPSVNQPGAIDRFNDILEAAGLGRPLGEPARITPAVVVLPVSNADPRSVRDTLRQATPVDSKDLFDVESRHHVDTVKRGEQCRFVFADFVASGKKSGHGTVTWTDVPAKEMPPAPPWPPDGFRPVVAVLDSGVQNHPWLPSDGEPPFCIRVDLGSSVEIPKEDALDGFGHYWGHATFLTGLIRLAAPDAQVLSLRVMNVDGKVRESDVLTALDWLATHKESGDALDVVLMAFGRPRDRHEGDPVLLDEAVHRLGRQGVKIVASAGNSASDVPTIPAILAEGQDSPVVSVGSGNSEALHAPYSNHGPWVHVWRCGTDVVSIMPLSLTSDNSGAGYAQWSGTSFSAAIYAGELAHERAAERLTGTAP